MYNVIKKRNCFWESTFVGVESYQSICVSSTLQFFFLRYLSLSYNSVCYMRTCRLGIVANFTVALNAKCRK